MMPGMASSPQVIWRKCQHSAAFAQQIIGTTASEERMMPAVVLDDEEPHKKARSGNRQKKSNPIGPSNT
jgi:hypothetical protein